MKYLTTFLALACLACQGSDRSAAPTADAAGDWTGTWTWPTDQGFADGFLSLTLRQDGGEITGVAQLLGFPWGPGVVDGSVEGSVTGQRLVAHIDNVHTPLDITGVITDDAMEGTWAIVGTGQGTGMIGTLEVARPSSRPDEDPDAPLVRVQWWVLSDDAPPHLQLDAAVRIR